MFVESIVSTSEKTTFMTKPKEKVPSIYIDSLESETQGIRISVCREYFGSSEYIFACSKILIDGKDLWRKYYVKLSLSWQTYGHLISLN